MIKIQNKFFQIKDIKFIEFDDEKIIICFNDFVQEIEKEKIGEIKFNNLKAQFEKLKKLNFRKED